MQSVNKLSGGELVAVDGKVLRGIHDSKSHCSAIHMVSAFATRNGVAKGQLKTEAKYNEITAIPAQLKLFELKGCLISIDAIGCQTSIADTIDRQDGDYLLAVKGSQKQLHRAVKEAMWPLCARNSGKNIIKSPGIIQPLAG